MIYTFATPYTGSDAARIAATFGNNPQFESMKKLASGSYIGSLQTRWSAFQERKQIRTFCAYETAPVVNTSLVDTQIVARESATNGCSERIDPIADNHIGIVKPSNDHSQSFIVFQNAYSSVFQPVATQLELNAQTLPSLVDLLRVDTRRRSYLVKGAVDVRKVASARETWFIENLDFAPDGVIYIGATGLDLKIRGRLTVPQDDQVIVASFPPEESKAPRGTDGTNGNAGGGASGTNDGNGKPGGNGQTGQSGGPGANGANSGSFSMSLASLPTKRITLALLGQKGGDGGNGGRGGDGGTGSAGDAGKSTAFGCDQGGGNGGPGGNGGAGGAAGPGGNGGAGGAAEIAVPANVREDAQQKVKASLEIAPVGSPGSGGAGGSGAASGGAGSGNGFCGGGRGAPNGANGSPGRGPSTTPMPGAAPTLVIKSAA